jgi:hypothetical protein
LRGNSRGNFKSETRFRGFDPTGKNATDPPGCPTPPYNLLYKTEAENDFKNQESAFNTYILMKSDTEPPVQISLDVQAGIEEKARQLAMESNLSLSELFSKMVLEQESRSSDKLEAS